MKSCIIERVNHCTKWCSPATFVPKPSGKGLRLVTDFRQINKQIRRPVFPFPDVNQLKSNIPPDTKFLAKLDFSSGYYQVGLAEKSRDLMCFLLPQGRFCYTRTPMGLASSGDLFVSRTMKIISDLPGIQALVDDVLVVATSFKQLIHRLYVLLQRLQKNQATISLKKFDINRALDVAGTNITCTKTGVEFRATQDSLNAFSRLREPTCKKELQSLLGMLNQFRAWDINISPNTSHLRVLLQKGARWSWSSYCQREFDCLKDMIASLTFLEAFNPKLKTNLLVDSSKTGIGYVLTQEDENGKISIVKCGSIGLSKSHSRYAQLSLKDWASVGAYVTIVCIYSGSRRSMCSLIIDLSRALRGNTSRT